MARTNPRGRILVVDDDASVRSLLQATFELEGFDIATCGDAAEARRAPKDSYDLVVLDLGLPGAVGLDLLSDLVAGGSMPVIVFTGIDIPEAAVRALDRGADDVVVKPSSPSEVVARVRAVLRRTRRAEASRSIEIGNLSIDTEARELRVNGHPVELTAKEFDLLAFLAAHPGKVFTRHQLMVGVWNSRAEWQLEATVTEHVRRLRIKIERDPRQPERLLTVRGVGYRFERRAVTADDRVGDATVAA